MNRVQRPPLLAALFAVAAVLQTACAAAHAHHVLTENASASAPARLLVVFNSNNGDALKTEDEHEGRRP